MKPEVFDLNKCTQIDNDIECMDKCLNKEFKKSEENPPKYNVYI